MKTKLKEGLNSRVALVSGATGGIGSAICKKLVTEGMHVVMLGRDEDKLELCRQLLSEGTTTLDQLSTQVVDISDADAVGASVGEVYARFPKIDLLVHAAGDGPMASLLETTEALWQKSIQSKLMGTIRLTRAVATEMCRYREGHIIIVNGVFSKEPDPLFPINSTINCALAGFAKSVARDLGAHGIRTNVVNPGATHTPLWNEIATALGNRLGVCAEDITQQVIKKIPLGRLATPRDVAEIVAMLANPATSYLNGVSLNVDGGSTSAL